MNLFIKFCIDIFCHTDRRAGNSAEVEFSALFFYVRKRGKVGRKNVKKNFDIWMQKTGVF